MDETSSNMSVLSPVGSFEQLIVCIQEVDSRLSMSAVKAINQMLTMRNWLIGGYIVEYEQKGSDRAEYGANLLKTIEARVCRKGLNVTLLQAARLLYRQYPHLADCLEEKYSSLPNILMPDNKYSSLSNKFITPANILLSNLSFSHFRELLSVEDPLARFFYETECIKGTWSVRELHRQIVSNLHTRVGLSEDKTKTMAMANAKAEHWSANLQIRDPYTFEFLGLKSVETLSEGDLEDALVSHLHDFLLEMGKGFCFEARQKRIIIDNEYYYADLVFYNRLLHCNVIVELKNDEFKHEYIGQLNAYVGYYAEHEMQPGDNPPIGILLCTRKGQKMVEYALGALDNNLFVSTYMLQLPCTEDLEDFLKKESMTD